jgi:beta-mannanase
VYDNYLRAYARDVKRWGKPVLLRLMHEMNGDYYPWSCTVNENKPASYVAAFRHVRDIFKAEKASNAKFVWSPNYASPPEVEPPCNDLNRLYPGDDYVDYIGVSVYNWGSDTSRGPGWTSLEVLVDDFLNEMAVEHPEKEVIIAETGTAHDQPPDVINRWIAEAYSYLATRGTVAAIVNFDDFAFHSPDFTDFRVTVGHDWGGYPLDPSITDAHRAAIRDYCD